MAHNFSGHVVTVKRPCFTPLIAISAFDNFSTSAAFPLTKTTSRQLS